MQVIDVPFSWDKGWVEFDRDVDPSFVIDCGHFQVLGVVPGMTFIYHSPLGEELYFQFANEESNND